MTKVRTLSVVLLWLTVTATAFAQTFVEVSTVAFNNATVQPSGPRSGSNGKRFFNIQGNNNASFASFGVVDFSTAGFGLTAPVVDVTNVVLKLYDAPARFSANGNIRFWLTTQTGVDIEPGTSPLRWNSSALPDGVDVQLSPLYLLGSGTYTSTGNDTEFVYPLVVPAAAKPYLLGRINAGSSIRLVVTPAEDGVSATFAGYNHATIRAPRLEMRLVPTAAVPEPTSVISLMVGLAGLAGVAWRRRRVV